LRGFAFVEQTFKMQEDGFAALSHGFVQAISRREAAGQIGDDNAECVLVAAGFNRNGLAHVHDSWFKPVCLPKPLTKPIALVCGTLTTHTECAYCMRINSELSMGTLYDLAALKKPTNLSINSDLLKKAKSLDINLSATLEAALAAEVKRRRADQWLKDNKASLDAYNAFVEKRGVWSDGLRGF